MAEFIGQRHEREPAKPGLHVLFGDVLGLPGKRPAHLLLERVEAPGNRDLEAFHPEIGRELEGVLDAVAGREFGWHRDSFDIRRTEGLDGETRGDRAVNPAAEPEHRGAKPALGHVVPQPENQRVAEVGHVLAGHGF